MKSILVVALLVSFACLSFGALRPTTPAALPAIHVEADAAPMVLDVPSVPSIVRVHEMRIVAQAQAPRAPRTVSASRVWACGAMYDNRVGGRNADCEWK